MENKIVLWHQIIEESKKFGCHNRLTPHIYALFRTSSKYLSNLESSAVLDVGAGDKRYENKIRCIKYISLDISGKVDVIGDAVTLPFKDGSFDLIICTQVLEHIKDPFKAVEEFSRILKEKGTVFITVPTVMYLHETPNDYFRYTNYGIEYILNNNRISVRKFETICSGFIVGIELLFIAVYSIIYKLIKPTILRQLLINHISYLSLIFWKFDLFFFRAIFPGNIMICAYKLRKGVKK